MLRSAILYSFRRKPGIEMATIRFNFMASTPLCSQRGNPLHGQGMKLCFDFKLTFNTFPTFLRAIKTI